MRNFFSGLGSGSGAIAAAALCVVLIAAGFYIQSARKSVDVSTKLGLVAVPEKTGKTVPAAGKAVEEKSVEDSPQTPDSVQKTDKDNASAAPAARLKAAPEFDEVRREADGVTVIAGRATPGAEVNILQNGSVIARATADPSGKFATVALTPPDGKGHVLSLLEKSDGNERLSDDEIILAPIQPLVVANAGPAVVPDGKETAEDLPAALGQDTGNSSTVTPEAIADQMVVTTQPGEEAQQQAHLDQKEAVQVGEGASTAAKDTNAPSGVPPQSEAPTEQAQTKPDAPAAPALPAPVSGTDIATAAGLASDLPDADPELETAPVAVLKSTAQGVELLNTPSPQAMSNVAIDTISYSEVGEVELAGRAQADTASVRVYLDNASVTNLPVDGDGRWRGELPDIDEGIYTLRVDEISTSGKITSRVETPFKRESSQVLAAAAATAQQDGPLKAITVQEGATLWAIARERYGDGALYVRVFEANSNAIRDPDLIYPGQIFDLPD
ncbi:LysM peptidoglycan-binding domain-containing protein [Sulfitobacter sp. F26204]|uniref:Ig-like domain-containing protein n=1 Tax=Sulfitobacter sp. F26204 TaxID=2996014 RepID=UPI00225E507D|nr:Ig-like domain-containing protein [Sulfitobacter sp. F26204]MCX7560776.1 LysM peptidoglycan-binding domain-containing protein [Sulfitobacter sp. F26204]